jgi:hypothetical protein
LRGGNAQEVHTLQALKEEVDMWKGEVAVMKDHSREAEAQHAAAAAAAAAAAQQLRDEVAHVRGQLCASEEERIAAVDAQARAEMRIAAGHMQSLTKLVYAALSF